MSRGFFSARDYSYDGRAGCGLGDAKNSAYGSGGTSSVASPHQVSDLVSGSDHIQAYYDTHGNGTTRLATAANGNVSVKYSLDDRAYEMTSNAGGSTRFWYGSDGSRYKRVDGGRKTLYLGNVEVEIVGGTTTYKRTVAGVMLQTSATASGAATNYYLFHDQLGSLVRITNAAGAVVNRLDFVAYGGRRDVDTQAANAAPPSLTTRGFTGHEMVETAGVNLIHMNGRIYDPTIGRFLQPDPVIQAPDNPQSWNAYTYVFNNPLAYTDPTGMIGMKERQWLGAIVAIVAVVCQQYWALDGAAAFFYAAGVGAVVGGITTGTWRGAAIGAFSGAVTWGIATYVPGTYQVLAQAVSGGVMESLQGGNFGHGFVAAGLTASVMPEVGQITNDTERVLTGALVGGTLSEITGGNFANGAVSGAIQAAMAGGAESSHSSPDGSGGRRSLTREKYAELQDEFDALAPKLNSIRARSPQAAADAFGAAALPFTQKWGFEIGANIVGGGRSFRIDDVTLGYFGGVTIPQSFAAIADVHTHPGGGAAGFSGAVMYNKAQGVRGYSGDLSTNYSRNVDGYVFRVGGGAWHFNQGAFRSDLASAMKTGATIDSRWSRYVEQIR